MSQCCNLVENAIFCAILLYSYAIQVYLPYIYEGRRTNRVNIHLATPLPFVDDPSNTIACPVEWGNERLCSPVNFTFGSMTKQPTSTPRLLYFAQYCYMFKLYFRKSYQNHYNTTLYTSKQRLFLLYFLQYRYNISIYYTILQQK